MRRDRVACALSVGVAWAAAAVVAIPASPGVTAPVGLLLVALPGYAWLRAVHPRSVYGIEVFAGVTAIALGLLVVSAFALSAMPWGLQRASWAIALALLVTVGEGVVVTRATATETVKWRLPHLMARQAIAIALGVAALAAACAVSEVSATSSNREHFTALSLVPRSEAGGATTAVLLVTNQEGVTVRYRLVFRSANRRIEYNLRLKPGRSFRRVELLRAGAGSARLYRNSSNTLYRRVWIGDPSG